MSFAQEVKKEIMAHAALHACCVKAAGYGVACFAQYFDNRGLVIHTEQISVAQYIKKLYDRLKIDGKVYVKGTEQKALYEFAVKEPAEVEKMHRIFGTDADAPVRIKPDLFACQSCARAFISHAFLVGGVVTNPEKDYNLEFVSSRRAMLQDLSALLNGSGFTAGQTLRKGTGVVYFKASEQIEDLLTYMGAAHASLTLMDTKIYKEMRNKVNRLINCDAANIEKTVQANGKIQHAAAVLRRAGKWASLPESLRQAAEICEQNPEASLKEMALLFEPPLSKSGLNHRVQKLITLAQEYEKENQNGGN